MPVPLPELPGVEHRCVALATGVRVHVAEAGPADAPPLVLLHGWPQHWWCWRRIVPLLCDDYRLLMADLRAFGWSGRPADGDLRTQRFADDAAALLDALGIARAGLVGHDWGGWAGFRAVLTATERWTGLVALGIPNPWVDRLVAARNLYRFAYQLPIATPVLGTQLVRERGMVMRVLKAAWGDRATLDEGELEPFAATCRQPAQAADASRLYRTFLLREAGRPLPGGRLPVPTRLLFGLRDPLGAALARGLERRGDDAAGEFLEGCGHFVPEERPGETAATIRAVL